MLRVEQLEYSVPRRLSNLKNKEISQRLGHVNVQTTDDICLHLYVEQEEVGALNVNGLLGRKKVEARKSIAVNLPSPSSIGDTKE
jgi:hypothetical protein